jgi:uncharacterized protein
MVVPGSVTNITRFGAFVDIGVKQDGLVHVSEIAHKYITDPNEVLKLNDKVQVKVLEVDAVRKRIALSIKQAQEAPARQERPQKGRHDGFKKDFKPAKKKEEGDTMNMNDALSLLKKKFNR